MQLSEAYTTLQGKLQQYEESGRLTPLTRRLATILTQAKIPAYNQAQLEGTPLWFGLLLNDRWPAGIYVQPYDVRSMQLPLRFNLDSEVEEHHILLYRQCTRAKLAATLERAVERLLMQTWEERRR